MYNTALLRQIPKSPAAAHGPRAPPRFHVIVDPLQAGEGSYVIKLLEGVQIEQPDGLTIGRWPDFRPGGEGRQ